MEITQLAPNPARPLPKTRRGRDTRDKILAAARALVRKQWVHETPFTDLAEKADVKRASLLHAFPHWRDVLWSLLVEELDQIDRSYEKAASLKRARPGEKAFVMLAVLLDRAETSERLYPNLRSAMFTWNGKPTEKEITATGDEPWSAELMGHMTLYSLRDHYDAVETLLGIPDPPASSRKFNTRPIGECLLNYALDLAAGYPSYYEDFDERRRMLRTCIEQISSGMRKSTRSTNAKRRTR